MKRIISIVLCLLLCLSLCGCSMIDYKKAVMLYEGGGYEGAKELFEALGDHEDSAEYAAKAGLILDYRRAVELYAEENYAEAKTLFEALGDYEKSAEYLKKIETRLLELEEQQLREKIVGRWKTEEVDMTELLKGFMQLEMINMGYTEADLSDIGTFALSAYYCFEENGFVTEELDRSGLQEAAKTMAQLTKTMIVDMSEQEINAAAENYGVSTEEVLASMGVSTLEEYLEAVLGTTVDEYISLIYDEEMMNTLIEAVKVSGTWYVKDGVLYVLAGDEFEKGEYDDDKDTITMLECEVRGESAEIASGEEFNILYPYTMNRADEAKPKA